ncbi:MAG: hypothetical protein ABW190_02755 [Rhizobacter sp.]
MNLKSVCASLTIFLSACGTIVHAPSKLYEGPLLEGAAPALLKPGNYVAIVSIDAKAVNYSAPRPNGRNDYELHLAPGKYRLGLEFNSGLFYSNEPSMLDVDLRAGGKYVLTYQITGKTSWRPRVVDVTDLPPNCWTIDISLPAFGPKGCGG